MFSRADNIRPYELRAYCNRSMPFLFILEDAGNYPFWLF